MRSSGRTVEKVEMSKIENTVLGFDDIPAVEDSLSISSYIRSLATFITNCPTPMTIAVQGNWGTGKTSAMLQVQASLAKHEEVSTVFFNTWQYSQFDLGENLAISMLKTIVNGIPKTEGEAQQAKVDKLKSTISKVSQAVAFTVFPAVLGAFGLGTVASTVSAGVDAVKNSVSSTEEPVDPVTLLASLREDFQDVVSASGQRLVVFVDDLDRLEPKRAIEVMEAIKVFLDVPNCVFVLAIDFDVVKLGVREKYGKSVSERKARQFFDKIIQVPFHMPVARYEMSPIFEIGLRQVGITPADQGFRDYMTLSTSSVGSNPRSTKRLLNTFLLLKTVLDSEANEHSAASSSNYLHVFGTLCLQTAFPEIYNAFSNNLKHEDPADSFLSFLDSEIEDRSTEWGINSDELQLSSRFTEQLKAVFVTQNSFDTAAFNRAFDQSMITNVSSTSDASSPRTKVFDSTLRRELTEEKRDRHVVDLAFAFEKYFATAEDSFASQAKPTEWTIRRTTTGRRLGLLTVRPADVRISMEFRTNAPNTWVPVKDKLLEVLNPDNEGEKIFQGVTLQHKTQKTRNYTLLQVDGITTLAQATELGSLLKTFYTD